MGINFVSFYDFDIIFMNFCDSVVVFVFHFIHCFVLHVICHVLVQSGLRLALTVFFLME